MLTLSVDPTPLDPSRRFLATVHDQLPFATSLALNRTARDVQQAYRAQTPLTFNQPVAFTRNAWRYEQASKGHLEASVGSAPGRRYLLTQSTGGTRRWKAYEGFIRGLAEPGSLPDRQLVPTTPAVNAAGNPRRSLFGELQSRLSTTDRGGFFIGTPRGASRSPGVYRRSRAKLIPFFLVADDAPTYSPRFPLAALGNATIDRVFPTHLANAIDRALASAR